MKIRLHQLSQSYDSEKTVLKSIDFSDEITAMAIIGPSGCGKSTLLRVIGGLIPKRAGEVQLGQLVLPTRQKELIDYRKQIGFVFQHGGLFSHITALDNIVLPLVNVHHWETRAARREAERLLARFGVAEQADKKPIALSGGQRQRVAIARAIAPKPQLLLLDEPTSALDPGYTNEVLDVINELKSEGLDFIIVTHHMGFARNACETLAFMDEGQIKAYGPSGEMFNAPPEGPFKEFLSYILEWEIQ